MLTAEQKTLIENGMGLVYTAAMRTKSGGCRIEWDEIFSLAQLALCKAAEKFRPDRGYAFSTFFMECFKNELGMEIRRRNASNRKINFECISLNSPMECDEKLELMETIYAPESAEPDRMILDIEKRREIREIMRRSLNDTVYKIIYMTFWKDMKQAEIAKELNISQSYVSRMIKDGKAILGEQMRIQGFGA